MAARWAKAIATSPPSLAQKLGITPGIRLAVSGAAKSPDVIGALATAKRVRTDPDLIIAGVFNDAELDRVLTDDAQPMAAGVPIWILYRKGRSSPLGETAIRNRLRAGGFMDTKVAAVSEELTALRFNWRRAP